MQNSIIKHRVAYFSIGSLSEDECYLRAIKCFPWHKVIHVCVPLGLVAVFSSEDDFHAFFLKVIGPLES